MPGLVEAAGQEMPEVTRDPGDLMAGDVEASGQEAAEAVPDRGDVVAALVEPAGQVVEPARCPGDRVVPRDLPPVWDVHGEQVLIRRPSRQPIAAGPPGLRCR